MSSNPEQITYFATTDTRGKKIPFGIKAKDRPQHVYVIGKTGMGKSTLLENMAVQDIRNGEGFAFIDPHGKSAKLLLDYIPEERLDDVLYFAPFDMENPIAFNIMEDVGYDKRHLVVSGLMSSFKKIWVDVWSSRMEYILQNTLLALLEYPGATLLDVNRMYVDKSFRATVVGSPPSARSSEEVKPGFVKDPLVKSFWIDEFATFTDNYTREATPAIQNKIGQFTGNPLIRNIIGQTHSTFDLRKMMDEKKILIVDLSKGQVGESNANLLGSMLITKIYLAALSRADVPEPQMLELPNFYMYVDEFQSFANESFADILSEARKYKLNLTMAHQYIEQMSEEVRNAVFGNVGTMVVFRVGAYDAEVLEKEFAPQFSAADLVNLGFAQIYLRLMIDGVGSQPFSATTLPPITAPELSGKESVIENSRKLFARPRGDVEKVVREKYEKQQKERRESALEQQRTVKAMNAKGFEPASRPRGRPRASGESYTSTPHGSERYGAGAQRGAPSAPRFNQAPSPPASFAPAPRQSSQTSEKAGVNTRDDARGSQVPVAGDGHRPFAGALGDVLRKVKSKALNDTSMGGSRTRREEDFEERKKVDAPASSGNIGKDSKSARPESLAGLREALKAVTPPAASSSLTDKSGKGKKSGGLGAKTDDKAEQGSVSAEELKKVLDIK